MDLAEECRVPVLKLASHPNEEARWRGVQGLEVGRQTAQHLSPGDVVPILIRRLSDPIDNVREAAALALAQRGEAVLDVAGDVVPELLVALSDSRPSVCGHAARLLAVASHRLTAAERKEALAGVDRAARRFAKQEHSYVNFGSLGIQASHFLQLQRGPLQTPIQWTVEELFQEIALPNREDRRLQPLECDRRLARAYARDQRGTIAAAIASVNRSSDRNTALGAANWLAMLGPAAESALPALDAMADGKLDSYARGQARAASESIRRTLAVDKAVAAASSAEESARNRLAAIERSFGGSSLTGPIDDPLATELAAYLRHAEAGVRTAAAELLMALPPEVARSSPVAEALVELLTDDAVIEQGTAGEFEFEGRLYHWRQERRAPRAATVRALFYGGRIPQNARMLEAMIAESMRAAVICGGRAAPHRFPIDQWRAAAAAGGLAAADVRIRTARQQCYHEAWSDGDVDRVANVAHSELAEVIRQLDGRLV